MTFDPLQIRVLGALIEKEITTPENYPLSLNALISACNQRSSRDPVLTLTEDEVRQALHPLEESGMVTAVHDSRVTKYEHRIRTVLNLRRDETAVLCLLMLRGPQTPGELRGRADRLYNFDDIAAVVSTLERLASHSQSGEGAENTNEAGPLVAVLARQPGSRESRYMHLLGGRDAAIAQATSAKSAAASGLTEEPPEEGLAALREELASMRTAMAELESRVAELESRMGKKPLPTGEDLR